MFSTLSKREIIISATFNLSFANAFNLVTSEILLFGNGLIELLIYTLFNTNFILFLPKLLSSINSVSLQTTILYLMEMAQNSPNREKTLWKKEKLLVTSNFSFSHSVFKGLVLQTHKNKGLFWNGLNDPEKVTF